MLTTPKQTVSSSGPPQTAERYGIYQLRPDEIDAYMPFIADWLDSVEKRSRGELMVSKFLADADEGKSQIWIVFNTERAKIVAVVGTRVETTGHEVRQARVLFCTGDGPAEWAHLFEEVKAWAKHCRCARIVARMRPGWTKFVKGFRVRHVEAEMALED